MRTLALTNRRCPQCGSYLLEIQNGRYLNCKGLNLEQKKTVQQNKNRHYMCKKCHERKFGKPCFFLFIGKKIFVWIYGKDSENTMWKEIKECVVFT